MLKHIRLNILQSKALVGNASGAFMSFRGISILDWISDFTGIDIETTGLITDYEEIIELSALRVRNNIVINSFSVLVKPIFEIDDFITE